MDTADIWDISTALTGSSLEPSRYKVLLGKFFRMSPSQCDCCFLASGSTMRCISEHHRRKINNLVINDTLSTLTILKCTKIERNCV